MSTTVRDDHSRGTSNFTRRLSFVDCSTVARRWGPFWATEATEIGWLTSKFWAAVLKGTWWQTIKLGGSIVGHTVIHCVLTKGNRPARSWNCMELFLATLRLMTRKTLISISGKNLEVWLATFLRLFVVKETWPLQSRPTICWVFLFNLWFKIWFGVSAFDFVQNVVFRFLDAWAPIFPPMSFYCIGGQSVKQATQAGVCGCIPCRCWLV